MPEQTSDENPTPERFDPHQIATGETRNKPEHFLAPILGRLSVRQAEVMLRRYNWDGTVAVENAEIAKQDGVSENAISQIVRRVWRDYPDFEPARTPRNEYVHYAPAPRGPVERDRPESYRLGEVEVSLSALEHQIMSARYDSQGRPRAGQKEIAEQLGKSQSRVSRIESRVLNDYPELAAIIQAVKAAEAAKAVERRKANRRKPKEEIAARKPAKKVKSTPPPPPEKKPSLPKRDFEDSTRRIDFKNLYDVSQPLDNED